MSQSPSSTAKKNRPSTTGLTAMSKLLRGVLEAATGITPEIRSRFSQEELCLRCGKCCFSAIKVKGRMVMLKDLPCKFLAFEPDGVATCTIYAWREKTGWCHRITVDSIRRELFPPDCPYMEGLPHYQGKLELSYREFEEIKPILKNAFRIIDKPEYLRRSDWELFLRSLKD